MVTIQFLPYSEIENLTSVGRIRKLLNLAKEDKIVLLQGRLRREEEAELIRTTMEEINREFSGIELSVIYPEEDNSNNSNAFNMFRSKVVNTLMGDRSGITVVGPANVVKEIRKDPKKLNMLTIEAESGSKKKRSAGNKTKKSSPGSKKRSAKSVNNGRKR